MEDMSRNQMEVELLELRERYRQKCDEADKLAHRLDEFIMADQKNIKEKRELRERVSKLETKCFGLEKELDGVREALKRETDMRFKAEKELKDIQAVADELEVQRKKAVDESEKWRTAADVHEAECEDLLKKWRITEDSVTDWVNKYSKLEKAMKEKSELAEYWRLERDRVMSHTHYFEKYDEYFMGRPMHAWHAIDMIMMQYGCPTSFVLEEKLKQLNELKTKVDMYENHFLRGSASLGDKLMGRTLDQWSEFNAVLAKHHTSAPGNLDCDLTQLESFRQMLRDWHFKTLEEFSTYINKLNNYKIVCQQNLIGSTDELKKSLDELKTFRLSPFRSLGKEWRDVVDKYDLRTPDELENLLAQRQRIIHRLCGMVREEIG